MRHNMEVVYHIAEKDLEALVARMIARFQEKPVEQDVWLTPKEALRKLNMTSKTSLYQLRVKGEITYTQPRRRVIQYSLKSIQDYLNRNIKRSF
jgi:poly(A) polymerase Pap1